MTLDDPLESAVGQRVAPLLAAAPLDPRARRPADQPPEPRQTGAERRRLAPVVAGSAAADLVDLVPPVPEDGFVASGAPTLRWARWSSSLASAAALAVGGGGVGTITDTICTAGLVGLGDREDHRPDPDQHAAQRRRRSMRRDELGGSSPCG